MERPAQRYFCNKCGYVGNVDLHSGCGYLAYHLAPFEQNYIDQLERELALLKASPASAPEGLFVREDAMHESNGRVTYFVHLAKSQDAKPWDCYVVYSDAIQGRAQYEAAQLRHFLGQGPKPDILTFDTDAPTPPVSEDRKDAERLHAILETLKMEFYIAEIDAHHPEVHAIRKLRTSLFAKLTEILKAPTMQEDKS